MTAAGIAAALGGARRSGQWWRCVCPVHGSRTGRSLTLALRDHPRGLAMRCHAGCSRDAILAELHRLGLLADRVEHRPASVPAPADRSDDSARRVAVAHRLWEAAQDARGSTVASYLRSRGIDMPPPPSLRWARRCWHREAGAELPAMVARVDDLDGRLIGVHRTYLARDDAGLWNRRDRASLGPIGGGAARLGTVQPHNWLVVGEGIETTLSVMQACNLPGWAALSAIGVRSLILPLEARNVLIATDNDANRTGQGAAYAAAQRWIAEGRRVRIAIAPEPGTDFNDVLLGQGYPRITEARAVAA